MSSIEDSIIYGGITLVIGIFLFFLAHNSRKDWKKRQKSKLSVEIVDVKSETVSPPEVEVKTEQNTPTFDEKTFSVFWSLFFIALAIGIFITVVKDFVYYLDDKPVIISNNEMIHSLKDNDFIQTYLKLDSNNSIVLTSRSIEYHLIPFTGTDNEFFIVIKGPILKGELGNIQPPFKGRISTKNFMNRWRFYERDYELERIFDRNKIIFSPTTKILYLSDKEFPGIWKLFISVLSLLYLIVKLTGIVRYLAYKFNKKQDVV